MLPHRLPLMMPCLVAAFLVVVLPLPAQERRERSREEIERILHGLGQGIDALKTLGDHGEMIEQLEEIRAAVKKRHASRPDRRAEERQESERDIVRRRIRVMRVAMKALLEAERRDSAEAVEYAIHARELALEERQDEEARHIRESAPDRGRLAELMALASQLWKKFGNEEAAGACADLARELASSRRRQQRDQRKGEDKEIEVAKRQLRVKRWALAALREAKRDDAADLMHRVVRALEVALEGRRDAEARKIRAQQPDLGAQVELLKLASDLYREWSQEDRAHACAELAEAILKSMAERDRPRVSERPPADRIETSIRDLQRRVERLEQMLKKLESSSKEKGQRRIR